MTSEEEIVNSQFVFSYVWQQHREITMVNKVTMETSLGAARRLAMVFQMAIRRRRSLTSLVCSTPVQDGTPSPRTGHLMLKPNGAESLSNTSSHGATI